MWFIVTFKREAAMQHDIQENSQSPAINLDPGILSLLDDFRRHVIGRATENAQLLARRDDDTKAKINELDILKLLFKQDVVQLDISMHYIILMTMVHCVGYLFKNSFRLLIV